MPIPAILVVVPPAIRSSKGPIAPTFDGGAQKCPGTAAYQKVCGETSSHFFDAGNVITSSMVDGVHLDAEQRLALDNEWSGITKPLLMENAF